MNAGMFCLWCGGSLESQEDHAICMNCGTVFTNATLSRTVSEGEESIAIETSVNIECIVVRSKAIESKLLEKSSLFTRQKVPQAPATIYG